MKKLFALSIIVCSTSAWAQCANIIDNSKVMLFIDTNDSGLEIATAQKAACQRGQKLVVIPKAYKEYENYVTKQVLASKALEKCANKFPNDYNKTQTECKIQIENLSKVVKEREDFKISQPRYTDEIKTEMENLRKSKGTLESFTISGHDGGGQFGGNKQSFSKQEVAAVMKDYEDINKTKSVMLLGCYTGVQQEVIDWQIIFPEVRLIGGYDGSAPLASRPQGHNYLYDLLTKEKILTKTADQKRLESVVKTNIRSLNDLNASMLIRPECTDPNEEKSYYYGKVGQTKVLRPFDMAECLAVKKELLVLKERLDLYDSGELEPPKDTAAGEMRIIYNKSRAHEHCAEVIGEVLNSVKSLGLLFYDSEVKNFAAYYDEEMREAEQIFKDLKIEDIISEGHKMIASQEEQYKLEEETIKEIEADPNAYEAKMLKKYEEDLKAYKDDIKDPKYKSLLEKMPYLMMIEAEDGGSTPASQQYQELTETESKLFNELSNRSFNLMTPKYEIENLKSSPTQYVEMKKQMLGYFKSNIESQRLQIDSLKMETSLGQVWIPTKKNLEGKTRKNVMDNNHKLNGILSIPFLPSKSRAALSWVNTTVGSRLQMFDNPFSWHEHILGTKPEAPRFDFRLKESLENSENFGVGGMSGGYGSGYNGGGYGYGGGGYVGGAASGSSGGGSLYDSERPIH